ncbi:hypothetical protein [Mesorhizobium huakuii]|uniref:DUF768 domain-containing protein n=1 Tax=Mesorhizobium huakuii TaxID=28104 RepID=UPI0032AF6FAD
MAGLDEHARHRLFVQWAVANVPDTVGADVISVAELTQKLFADAKALGIGSVEIEEDIGSAYEAFLDAIVHREAGVAE